MKILVRLPNWLGDMVMAVGFMNQLQHYYPGAEVSVIVKKGLEDLLAFFPPVQHRFVFDKKENKGVTGQVAYGKKIRQQQSFDLFFSLPDSFSSALIGFGTAATKRIGFKKDLRQVLLTNSFKKPENLHRVEEYIQLLKQFTGQPPAATSVFLQHRLAKGDHVVVNINSEASSRRLTTSKAVELLNVLRKQVPEQIVLIGSGKEAEFVNAALSQMGGQSQVESRAGQTTLPQLVELLATAKVVLTTDSGPSHLANALKTQTIVLFGAGNEQNTAPYNKEYLQTTRLGELSCEPCEKNKCYRYDTPQCLERLDSYKIASLVQNRMNP